MECSCSSLLSSNSMETIYSTQFSSFKPLFDLKSIPKLTSFKGISAKASYDTCVRKKGLSSIDEQKLGAADLVYHVNGKINPSYLTRDLRILDGFDDEYGGVIVDSERLPANPNVFASMLRFSVSHWKAKEKKGIWLKLPVEKSDLVPVAVKQGFEYHHAEKGYVMLTYWLPEGPSMLPANASHQVGVGGFVVNDKNESEEIYAGAVREVKEETGIDTEFLEVVAFRHVHNVAFEKSDLFFICMLKPLSTRIIVDVHEIQAAKGCVITNLGYQCMQWMPLIEFVENLSNKILCLRK
ncbi:nudix hydrolase 8 isoform X3 [Gossypium hirsutum]|uniref:Nudix hydrolase 8 isoform X3 n=1 Tax=Gossypium hirsutum TaxID=3635 RepID=A0ABM2ZV92_GOSHI|nr:nudix hydrolase 8 isoform X3 [Gossypium hirsutum]